MKMTKIVGVMLMVFFLGGCVESPEADYSQSGNETENRGITVRNLEKVGDSYVIDARTNCLYLKDGFNGYLLAITAPINESDASGTVCGDKKIDQYFSGELSGAND